MTPTFRCSGCGSINRISRSSTGRPICGRCKNPLDTSGAPQDVDPEALERTISASPVPVLVDFWAAWCGPCRMAAPILAGIAEQRAGSLIVLKLNSDEHPDAGSRHGIRGIPAFLLFQNGREIARQVGLPPAAELSRWVASAAPAA